MAIIKRAAPNGWQVQISTWPGCSTYFVYERVDGEWETQSEHDTLEEAEKAFDSICAELARKPNMQAQAAYDEEHGTDNGYDPRIEMQRREY